MRPQRRRPRHRTRVGCAAELAASWALAALVAAVVGMARPALAEDAPAPIVELDQLLVLPDSLNLEPEKRGGATKAEWRARFESARRDLAEARAALARTQAKLEDVASGSSAWKMGAPGLGATDLGADAPLDYSLSNEMRRNREEVQRSERRLSELQIEANLAGVPPEWQGLPPAESPSSSQEPE